MVKHNIYDKEIKWEMEKDFENSRTKHRNSRHSLSDARHRGITESDNEE
jgi:hypothetical protein